MSLLTLYCPVLQLYDRWETVSEMGISHLCFFCLIYLISSRNVPINERSIIGNLALPTLILQLSTHASAFDMYRYVRASIAPTFRTSGYIQNPLDCTQQLTDLDTAWRTCMNINLGPLCVSDPNCFVLQPRGMPCVFNISTFQATP
ncbi:Hypothetical predicted protein [Mytilus galloprovincialis]|uniref:Uncharacterized protein n=1 Tax=Mytilus galloprovincialis TaxID=29158 RepID=A0A8B6HD63_MYTGA|nr:Hypothetical predicted protein [Mytilus galloprovincialis]